ncbi:hypothetical protein ACWEPL_59345 [Nonomuraea sp. NPDC004186]
MRPLLPCMWTAFEALERWTADHGRQSPRSATIPRPTSGDVVNTCAISCPVPDEPPHDEGGR